jgi:septum formation topological specificity factor MinE
MTTTQKKTAETHRDRLSRLLAQAMANVADAQRHLCERAMDGSIANVENDLATVAKAKVWARWASILEKKPDVTVATVQEEMLRVVVRWARYGHNSTSPVANICAAAEAAAAADVLEWTDTEGFYR